MEAQNLFKERVRERDLDNFLVEEVQASSDFRDWLISKLPKSFFTPDGCEIRIQKSPPRLLDARQTDVSIGWFDGNGKLAACVLIESKVTADFQAGQAEAYAAEVREHQVLIGRDRACSLLVAPAAKLRALTNATLFNAALSIEDIAEYLMSRRIAGIPNHELDGRIAVRVDLLLALAGKRGGDGWEPVTIKAKRDFSSAYMDLAKLIVPQLSVRSSADGPKALTKFFDGLSDLSSFPCGVRLKHEFGKPGERKYANLQFDGQSGAFPILLGLMKSQNVEGMYATISGKSLFARIDTPGLSPDGERFEEQRSLIVEGLQAVRRLAEWFDASKGGLAKIFQSSPDTSKAKQELFREFEVELRKLADRAISELGYRPRYFLDMLDDRGAEATAHHLLSGRPSEGFTKLWEKRRLDLSLEALAIQKPWASLFTDHEITTAKRRLAEAGYKLR